MQVCKQRYEVMTGGRLFPSSSSDKVYKVTAYRPNEFAFCSCPSYIFSRSKQAKKEGVHQNTIPGSCKHLDETLRVTCDWIQERTGDYRYDEVCPKCGGPLVDTDTAMIPDDPDMSIDDLRAMLAELRGEEAPAPLPKPQEFVVVVEARATWNVRVTTLTEDEALAAAKATVEAEPTALATTADNALVALDKVKAIAAAPFVADPEPAAKPARKTAARKVPGRSGASQKPVGTRTQANASALLRKAGK